MKLLLCFLSCLGYSALFSQAGSLDKSFGQDGKVITNFGVGSGIFSIAEQKDQKIIVTGNIGANLAVARYNSDGSFDAGFGTNGIVQTVAGESGQGRAIAIQDDDKIVIAGFQYVPAARAMVARYFPNGKIDSAFGIDGIILATIAGIQDQAYSVVVQEDGKILTGGESYIRSNPYLPSFSVFRFKTDGTPDSSFGKNGGVAIDFVLNGFASGHDIEIEPGNKIVITGYGGGATTDIAIARLKENGSFDSTFGVNGKTMQDFGIYESAYSARIDSAGKITTCGQSTSNFQDGNFIICRFKENGQLDSSFGNTGKEITDLYGGNDAAIAIALDGDFGIVACGYAEKNGIDRNITTVRYKITGSLDSSFGENGFGNFDTTVISSGSAVAVQSDGKILVGGSIGGSGDFILMRYLGSRVLASRILSFIITENNNIVQLSWRATGAETDYFNIQRSIDGRNFYSIGKVSGKNNNRFQTYSYTDADAAALDSKTIYYRLQEVDRDGSVTYGIVRSINLANAEAVFIISPNPARDYIEIIAQKDVANAQIVITDLMSRKLYSTRQNFVTNQQITIPLMNYAKGVLILTINYEGEREWHKILKQ